MANGFSTFRDEHQYVTGTVLITVGIVGSYGAITGYLGSMLSALFAPDLLVTAAGAQADNPSGSSGAALAFGGSALGGGTGNFAKSLFINPVAGKILSWVGL